MIGFVEHLFTVTINYSAIVNLQNLLGHVPFLSLYSSLHCTNLSYNRSSLHRFGTDHAENTTHVIIIVSVHWRAGFCLATSCHIRPLRENFHCCAFESLTEPLPSNDFNTSVTLWTSINARQSVESQRAIWRYTYVCSWIIKPNKCFSANVSVC
jgi:hypothetical protein